MRLSKSDKAFNIIVTVIYTLLFVVIVYPLYFVVIASVSDPSAIMIGKVTLYPQGFSLEGYKKVIEYQPIWTGYVNTLIYTAGYTALSVFVTMTAGFSLSRKNLPGRNLIMGFMVFTMFFSGGLIPTFLQISSMGLVGKPIIIIILGSVSVYNIIIARTFISSNIPNELFEAASIDGCNVRYFFIRVVLPLSPALLAVLVLFNAVGQWNSWFNAMIYLRKPEHMPLQIVLRDLIVSQSTMMSEMGMESQGDSFAQQALLVESMKYAVIVVATLPIMCLYPFVQKYFVKGVMVGSIKG